MWVIPVLIFAVIGIGMLLITRAASFSVSVEPENGSASNVSVLSDSTASGGKSIRFGSVTSATDRGPKSYSTLAQARTDLGAPADANYVTWNPSWPKDRDLEDVFSSLGSNDILVLPERPEPYIVDSSEGFRAQNVKSVTGRYGQLPIVSSYKGKATRTWFAMARARRGIIGMGPGAVIQMSQSSWTQEPQIEDKGSTQSDGFVSPGRFYTKLDGTSGGELIGSQEKVIEAESGQSFFGNFRMKGRDLGGVAYNGIAAKGGTFVRLDLSGGWRGFQPVPNGETGGISTGGKDRTYLISKCILGTRDDSGKRVGSSPIMVNSSLGGTIEDTDASESVAGMLTIWNSWGKHTLRNVNTRFNQGPGLNLEKNQSGLEIEWLGGSIWSDYQGNGGKSPKPADQGTGGKLHLNIFTEGTSAKITLRGVDIDKGPTAGAVNVQSYGTNQQQKLSDITAFDAQGNSIPIKVYGPIK